MPSHYRIGTSGWVYPHWRDRFYPHDLAQSKWFDFFSQEFDSVELNNSFYRLPAEDTWRKWAKAAPKGFMFAVKASRFITHIKRLKDCEEPLEMFLGRARLLGDSLGPVLYQLPPNFHYKTQNVERLTEFLSLLPQDIRHVFEFRHDSWFNADLFSLLRIHNAGFCAFHTAGRETPLEATTDFAYVRFHGPDGEYDGSYSDSDLAVWAGRLRDLPEDVRDVFVYFNNDTQAFAVTNARKFIDLITPFALREEEEEEEKEDKDRQEED
jgi:uncharacterized protein YecE (DUF72 family)